MKPGSRGQAIPQAIPQAAAAIAPPEQPEPHRYSFLYNPQPPTTPGSTAAPLRSSGHNKETCRILNFFVSLATFSGFMGD